MSELTQRKGVNGVAEETKESKAAQLQQYAIDDGHFSLVRCAIRSCSPLSQRP
jgi:pyruvate carboxylase